MSDPADRLAALLARLEAGPHLDPARTHRSRSSRRLPFEAATALVLAPGVHDIEVAIIERTQRIGDRWSGHLALPGGRREAADRDLGATASRETSEEVGLRLEQPHAHLHTHRTRSRPGLVACYVFSLSEPAPLVPEPREVATAWWVPLGHLADPRNRTSVRHTGRRFPAIDIDGRPLWGLTLGMLERFSVLTGEPLATGPADQAPGG